MVGVVEEVEVVVVMEKVEVVVMGERWWWAWWDGWGVRIGPVLVVDPFRHRLASSSQHLAN